MKRRDPHPDRLWAISEWHAEQAQAGNAVAALNITITAEGRVRSNAIGIEPVHAEIILQELARVAPRLRAHMSGAPEALSPAAPAPTPFSSTAF